MWMGDAGRWRIFWRGSRWRCSLLRLLLRQMPVEPRDLLVEDAVDEIVDLLPAERGAGRREVSGAQIVKVGVQPVQERRGVVRGDLELLDVLVSHQDLDSTAS